MIHSIRKNCRFRIVYKEGKSLADRFVVMYIFENGEGFNRLGVCVSKKVGGAVVRNKVKRRIKEVFRFINAKPEMFCGYDIVIVARNTAGEAGFDDFKRGVEKLFRRHGLLDD